MPGCCAVGCSNASNKYRLYSIPNGKNDKARRKIWISRINRVGQLPTFARLCEVHFDPSQFEKNVPGKLKPNAVPSIFPQNAETSHKKRKTTDSNAISIVDHTYVTAPSDTSTPSQSSEPSGSVMEPECIISTPITAAPGTCFAPTIEYVKKTSNVEGSIMEPEYIISTAIAAAPKSRFAPTIEYVKKTSNAEGNPTTPERIHKTSPSIAAAPLSYAPTIENLKACKREIQLLRKKLRRVEMQKKELENKYSKLFNDDQVNFLKCKKTVWSQETVKKALELRFSCGINGYDMLLSQGYPLPSQRTLRRKLITEVFNVLSLERQAKSAEEEEEYIPDS